jgi:hypothetical protein
MGFDVSLIGVDGVGGSLCQLAMVVSFCADVSLLSNAYAQAYAMHITHMNVIFKYVTLSEYMDMAGTLCAQA